jgi:serine protease Do
VGVEARDLTPHERMRGFRGVVITKVLSDGQAAEILRPGDLVIALNGSQISSSNEFYLHLAASAEVQATSLHLIREGQALRVSLPPPEK